MKFIKSKKTWQTAALFRTVDGEKPIIEIQYSKKQSFNPFKKDMQCQNASMWDVFPRDPDTTTKGWWLYFQLSVRVPGVYGCQNSDKALDLSTAILCRSSESLGTIKTCNRISKNDKEIYLSVSPPLLMASFQRSILYCLSVFSTNTSDRIQCLYNRVS